LGRLERSEAADRKISLWPKLFSTNRAFSYSQGHKRFSGKRLRHRISRAPSVTPRPLKLIAAALILAFGALTLL